LIVIVQARLSSARLPGKVLRPLAGRPLLGRLLDRLQLAKRAAEIIVATSVEKDDDQIAHFCAKSGVRCFRGPLADVAERLAGAAESVGAPAFVRVSGDSPFMSPVLVDEVITLYQAHDVDLATNVQVRTFPAGLSVEAIRLGALRRAQKLMLAGEAEHVTQAFYRRPRDFRIANLASGQEWGGIHLSVDTPESLMLAEKMYEALAPSEQARTVREVVALHERCIARAVL
jgi:spore coat polysaccharide biosynthesis protein SpsF